MGFVTPTSWILTAGCFLLPQPDSKPDADVQTDSLESRILNHLDDADLAPWQLAAIYQLTTIYEPLISRADKEAKPTDEQRAARAAAVETVIAQGKRGAAAGPIIAAAGALTDAQRAAEARAARLRNNFDAALQDILNEDQWEKLKEQDYQGTDGTSPGSIVVRLSQDVPDETFMEETLIDASRKSSLTPLTDLLLEYELTRSQHVVSKSVWPEAGRADRPEEESKLIRRLQSYWRIDAGAHAGQLGRIITQLNQLAEVDLAYEEFSFTEPSVIAGDDIYCPLQEYLDPAPRGIDARYAWTQPHGTGAGIGLLDIERGWHEFHEDYQQKTPVIVFGHERPQSQRHGTAVLGEAAADDNQLGVVGIAPSASYVFMASYYQAHPNKSVAVADTICHVLPLMNQGDVLLLEVQVKKVVNSSGEKRYFPAEVDDVVFDAIQLATYQGIIVVAAAGNGNQDLDTWVDASGKQSLNRDSPDFRDSGAIMVGSSDAGPDHNRHRQSNFGSRIDCYGWGSSVTTTGHNGNLDYAGGNVNAHYTRSFNGTSSAAPIVAGAAMILQGMSTASAGRLILPTEMRAILADPLTGTPQGGGRPGHIGVMPDLRAIITAQGDFVTSRHPASYSAGGPKSSATD